MKFTLRHGHLNDLAELQQLFKETIMHVCKADYAEEQRQVWASGTENTARWQTILTEQYVLVAEVSDRIVGFCTLDKGHYLDMLYVHKDYQGKGIAHQLYVSIEAEAKRQGKTRLTADVSKTALLFFEQMGFRIVTEQTVVRHGVALNNFKMEKILLQI